jgi:phosphatidate phosphatase LPIN
VVLDLIILMSNDQPSESVTADAGNSDQLETSEIVSPEHTFDHGKEMESNCNDSKHKFGSPPAGRNGSSNETDNCLQTSVKEEVVEIYTHDTNDFRITSTTEQAGSGCFSNDLVTDKSIRESVDASDRSLHNFDDVTGSEIHTEEFLSVGLFDIQAAGTEITKGKNEVVSHFVTGDSDGGNQISADANLPTHCTTDVSTERRDFSSISSAQDVVEDKMVIVSSTETVEEHPMGQ